MLLRETPSCRARSLTFSPASIRRNASSLNSRLNRLGSLVLKWSSSERRTVTIFLSQARGALQFCHLCLGPLIDHFLAHRDRNRDRKEIFSITRPGRGRGLLRG